MAIYDVGSKIGTDTTSVVLASEGHDVNVTGNIWATASWSGGHRYVSTYRVAAGVPVMTVIDSTRISFGTITSPVNAFAICKMSTTEYMVFSYDEFLGGEIQCTVVTIDASGAIVRQGSQSIIAAGTNEFYQMRTVLASEVTIPVGFDNYSGYMVVLTYMGVVGAGPAYELFCDTWTYNPSLPAPDMIRHKQHLSLASYSTWGYTTTLAKISTSIFCVSWQFFAGTAQWSLRTIQISLTDPLGHITVLDTQAMGQDFGPHYDMIAMPNFTNGYLLCGLNNRFVTVTINSTTGAIAVIEDTAVTNGVAAASFLSVMHIVDDYYVAIGIAVMTLEIDNTGNIDPTALDQAGSDSSSYFTGGAYTVYKARELVSYGNEDGKTYIVWEYDGGSNKAATTFYVGVADPVAAEEHTEFVTSIIHRWRPGSFTMELLLGGLEDAWNIPAISDPKRAEEDVKAFKAAEVPVAEYVKKPANIEYLLRNIPVTGMPTLAGKDMLAEQERNRAATQSQAPNIPGWVVEKADTVARTETSVLPASVTAARRISKLISSKWRR